MYKIKFLVKTMMSKINSSQTFSLAVCQIVLILILLNGENRYYNNLSWITPTLVILSIFLIFFGIKNNFKNNFKIFNLIGISVVFYIISFIVTSLSDTFDDYKIALYLAACSLLLFSVFYYLESKLKNSIFIFEYNVFYLILSFLVINIFLMIKGNINLALEFNFDLYNNFDLLRRNFGESNFQRPTGTSRIFLLLAMSAFGIYYFKNNFPSIIFLIISFLAIIFLILFQSRTVELILLIYLILLIILPLKRKMSFVFLFVVIFSVIIALFIQNNSIYNKRDMLLSSAVNTLSVSTENHFIETEMNVKVFKEKLNHLSSGRVDIWEMGLSSTRFCFYGCGVNSDRYFLNRNNVHNGYIYMFISMGVWSVLFFYIFAIVLIKTINQYNENPLYFWLIIYFICRMFFENSMMIFGFDQVLFCLILFFVTNKSYFYK